MKSLDFSSMENVQAGALPGLGSLPIGDVLAIVTGLLNGVVTLGVGTLGGVEKLLGDLLSSVSVLNGL